MNGWEIKRADNKAFYNKNEKYNLVYYKNGKFMIFNKLDQLIVTYYLTVAEIEKTNTINSLMNLINQKKMFENAANIEKYKEKKNDKN